MLNVIAAALVAAAPAPAPVPPADAHAQHRQMGHAPGAMKPGMMAEMKDDCCCKDKMSKMHQGDSEAHQGHSGR